VGIDNSENGGKGGRSSSEMTKNYGGYEDQEFIAEYYDAVYERIRPRDIDFYTDYAREAGGRTLELACGTGMILVPIAVSGSEITGLDLSPYMLKKCREKLDRQSKAAQERVKLVQGNMTDFATGETYNLVIVPLRSFQHLLPVAEQKVCLNCVHQHLNPQGRLIIDVFHPSPDRLVPNPKYTNELEDLPETELPDGRKLRRTNRTAGFHREQQYNDIEIIYYITHPDGRKERLVQSFPMRYLYRYEMEHLLALCGFRVVNLFGDFDGSEFATDSPEMIFVAEKQRKGQPL
jgi:SAM-dependent methyltransferase